MRCIIVPAVSVLLLGLAACPEPEPEAERVCEPGRRLACPCSGGHEGWQTCLPSGQGWSECDCLLLPDAGQGDAEQVDGALADARTDAAAADALAGDATAGDAAAPDLGADAAVADSAVVDALAADSSAPDQVAADAGTAEAGQDDVSAVDVASAPDTWQPDLSSDETWIHAVEPATISIAGGTLITVTATGLADPASLTVEIDGTAVVDLARPDQHTLTFRSAGPMTAGSKSLLLRNEAAGEEHATTIEAVDLTDRVRLHSGGPIHNNLNVTVVRDDTNGRVDGAVVFVGPAASVSEGSYNKRVTDSDGMVVLSGDQVASGPVNLTVGKLGFETQTLVGLDAQNATVVLRPRDPDVSAPGIGTITGLVTGWANAPLPAGTPTNRYYRVAYVTPSDRNPESPNYPSTSAEGPYAIEIRADHPASSCTIVLMDGTPSTQSDASYAVSSMPGTRAVLARVLFWDSVDGVCGNQPYYGTVACQQQGNQNCEGWLPVADTAFGITTDVELQAGGTTAGVNIVLDVPAEPFAVNINGNPTYAGAQTAYTAELYLDLGSSGTYTFAGELQDNGVAIDIGLVPGLTESWTYTVRGFVAAAVMEQTTIVDISEPISTSFLRGWSSGTTATVTSWIFFPGNLTSDQPGASEGRFSYTRTGGLTPDVTQVEIRSSGGGAAGMLWTVLASGDPGTITLPDLSPEEGVRMEGIPAGTHRWQLFQLAVNGFDYDDHTAVERTALGWWAAVQAQAQEFTHN